MNTKAIFKLITLFLLVSITCSAQIRKDTLNVLFVGNSYTYYENLPQIVSLISNASKTKIVTKQSTMGGSKLRQHWLGERGLKTKELIKSGTFDIVVLQGHSMATIKEPDSLVKYSKLLCDYIKKHNAKPYFYLTWAREKTPQMQEAINKVYTDVSRDNDATLVPVGTAWLQSQKLDPSIKLFKPDGSHPSRMGTFLTACVFVKSILGELPNKISSGYYTTDTEGESIYLMQIPALNLDFFRKVVENVMD